MAARAGFAAGRVSGRRSGLPGTAVVHQRGMAKVPAGRMKRKSLTAPRGTVVVTGAAGFVGSNLAVALNQRSVTDILAVDDLSDGTKCRNLADAEIADYMDKEEFLARVIEDALPRVIAVFHQGACSTTTEWNGK